MVYRLSNRRRVSSSAGRNVSRCSPSRVASVAALRVAEVLKNRSGSPSTSISRMTTGPVRGGEIGFVEVSGDLRGKLAMALIMGALGPVAHLLQQMAAPLLAIADPAGQPVRMQTDADHIDRRFQQLRCATGQQLINGSVGVDDVPVLIQQQRGVRQVGVEESAQAVHHHRDRHVVQLTILIARCVAAGQQESIAIPQRHIQVVGEVHDHLRCRVRLAGLHPAEVPGGDPRSVGQLLLTEPAPFAPGPQQRTDRRGFDCNAHVRESRGRVQVAMTCEVMARMTDPGQDFGHRPIETNGRK